MGALLLAPRAAQAFYLPGVAPTNFIEGQRVELKVLVAVCVCDRFEIVAGLISPCELCDACVGCHGVGMGIRGGGGGDGGLDWYWDIGIGDGCSCVR